MNLQRKLAEVLVVGAGPVGLTTAAELVRHGVSVRIIDQNLGPVPHSQAIIIHARTLEVFTDMGVVEPILEAGQVIHGGSIFADNKRIVHFDLDELESPYRFALDLPQSSTERILTAHLEQLGVNVERRTTLSGFNQDDDRVTAYLRRADGGTESLRVEYLVGCDGSHSTVRHTLGLQFEAESTFENFLLADVRLDWDLPDDEWTLWFHEDGLLSVFPLPGGMYRIIADDVAGDASYSELLRVWNVRAPIPAQPAEPDWICSLRINYRKVKEYRSGRVFIAGDAAHVHSPAGGQGMNTGIQDAYNLAWKLGLALSGTAAPELLDSYTAEREPVAGGVLDLTDRMTSLATVRHPVSQTIRNRIFALLAQFEIIEQRVVNRFGETVVNYRHSPLVGQAGHWYGASPLPGDRAPRVENILRSPRFKVLVFTGEKPEDELLDQIEILGRYTRDGYGDHADFWIITRDVLDSVSTTVADGTGVIHHRYGAGVPCVYVIRPDNYIGFRSLGVESLPVLEYFGRIFDTEPKVVESI